MSASRVLSRFWRPAPVAGLLALVAVTSVGGANAWVGAAARGRSYGDLAAVPARSVAIVPGSRVTSGEPSPHLRDRLDAALTLYRQGRVKAILVSGNDTPASPEASVMHAWLLARGVPAHDVWTDEAGSRTRETMRRAAGLFGVTDAIVCTQELNMSRTLYLAQQSGIDAVGVTLPTELSRSPRWLAREALKTALSFVESQVREGPDVLVAEESGPASTVVAAR
jgi:vancomycin permeability regulator SanA